MLEPILYQSDPVLTLPARLNEEIITPLGDVLDSINLKAAGIVALSNKRFPFPRVMGKIFSQSSSTKSFLRSV